MSPERTAGTPKPARTRPEPARPAVASTNAALARAWRNVVRNGLI